ncbi:MAG: hypothetical protein AB1782_04665, partial [Cyanobacteriota bacterium]
IYIIEFLRLYCFMFTWKFILKWILSYLFPQQNCKHLKVNPFSPYDNFCPDCGERVLAQWYILKCENCLKKRNGYYIFNEYIPHEKFCKRCGHSNFYVEIKDDIQVYDFAYASYKFIITKELNSLNKIKSRTQVWIEPNNDKVNNKITPQINAFPLIPVTVTT